MRLLYLFLTLLAQATPVLAIQWHEPWNVRANGQELMVETFSSRLPVDVIARRLVHKNDAFERYLVGDGRLLLSGVRPGVHWLAEIHSRGDSTHGYVSALYFDAARYSGAIAASAMTDWHVEYSSGSGSSLGIASRLFEFEGAVQVGMFEMADNAVDTLDLHRLMPAVAAHTLSQHKGTSAPNRFTFVTSGRHAAPALAVAMPEQ